MLAKLGELVLPALEPRPVFPGPADGWFRR
jgi:hypothetical protein